MRVKKAILPSNPVSVVKRLLKDKLIHLVVVALVIAAGNSLAQTYEAPPSSSTTSSDVPYISDEAMEQCVILYNTSKWLDEEIGNTKVDEYSQASVDAYNEKIDRHAKMINDFNRDCAGRQSESAYKAAQELNKKSKGS